MGERVNSETMVEKDDEVTNENENYSVEQLGVHLHKELVIINGRINDMDRDGLIQNLRHLHLSTCGNITALRKRLKAHYRTKKLPPSHLRSSNEICPFYIVIDFEATCNAVNPPDFRHEIIEFPAVLVDSRKRVVVDEFHEYVKPAINSTLTEFCSKLTGISQETVDNANDFTVVLNHFDAWLKKHKFGSNKHKYCIVTDGPWDMGKFLSTQCEMSQVPFPYYAKKWVNIRKTYSRFYRTINTRLPNMLEEMGIELQGRLHSGLDDSRNIASLLIAMINDGAVVKVNESLKSHMARARYAIRKKGKSEKLVKIIL